MTLCALRALAIVVFTSGLASPQTAAPAPSAMNFDGEWSGSGGIRLVLRSDPGGLTGTLMEPAGAGPITIERGSVSGRTATFVTSRSVNGEPVTVTWTAELNDDDTLSVSRLMDSSSAGREGRSGAGARGRGERGAGARVGRGAGRAGRGRAGGGAPPEAGRAGGDARGRSGERGRAGGERGRAGGDGRGTRAGGPAARGADPFGSGFPEILRRVP